MPYLITTKREASPLARDFPNSPPNGPDLIVSRRAVATLDEAPGVVFEFGDAAGWSEQTVQEAAAATLALSSGGSVGPLPDGTVIEVAPKTFADLDVLGWLNMNDEQIIAAYNARGK